MHGESMDIKQDRLQKLKEQFPELFAEEQLDWEKLKAAFGDDINFANERYVLNWAGKSDAFKILQQPTTATLKPVPEESVDFDTTENLFIEGENLEVLKALQKAYYNKVKCIIIDPPYNTGSDSFIYPDKFSERKEDYLKRIGDKDEEGFLMKEGLFRKNSKESGHFHSNWLSMIYPRLFLAKNLLRDDGVIFVHIDDNEVHNLRMVMNEIFGEENFVAQIIWQSKTGSNDAKAIDITTEYILVFAKNISTVEFSKNNAGYSISRYKYKDDFFETRGPYYLDTLDRGGLRYSDSLNFGVDCPDGTKVFPNGRTEFVNDGWTFKWSLGKIKWGIENKFIEIKKQKNGNSEWKAYYKVYLNVDNEGNVIERGSTYKNLITEIKTGRSSSELNSLFNFNVFKYSKPYEIIVEFLSIIDTQNDIILDFFAGSATTAHAVLELNKEDGGNRKFILVQMPEPCDEGSEAFKAGYKTIADIGKERIRRVIKKIQADKEGKLDLEQKKQDLGFKVFKLAPSNFKIWRGSEIDGEERLLQQLDVFVDPLRPGAEKENMLYELMLKSGYTLTCPVQYVAAAKGKGADRSGYYSISNNELVIALDVMNEQLVEQIIVSKPLKVITLDILFKGNDQLKTNTVLQMRDAGVDFKTI
ncbi:MAG: site-specific DNA-methyltransferase [Nitrospirae bacterium]|nr:site-specific DNA-methyltransferase [Nitrospirota bacterium]